VKSCAGIFTEVNTLADCPLFIEQTAGISSTLAEIVAKIEHSYEFFFRQQPCRSLSCARLGGMAMSARYKEDLMEAVLRRGWGWRAGLVVLGLFYIVAGINHFRSPLTYLAVMPPYIPRPLTMIYISGIAEILGGIGVFVPDGFVFPRTRAFAAWGIVALLIAVSPVHIHMALHPEQFSSVPLWAIWLRLPLQLPLIAWAWYYTRRQVRAG
jgi:uncharacterized membrane protein